jgi:glycosyltransferase involved in cell wall biosynthesis
LDPNRERVKPAWGYLDEFGGGNAEAVVDGETGIVVPPHDPQSFGEAIVQLATDRALRRSYGAAERRRGRSALFAG